jgi:hypothetical protein
VCAVYVGSGIVKDLYQLGRVLKLLTSTLEKCKDDADITRVGEIKDISPHASIMVKLSVLNAWAELQVATVHQDYLRQVVQPNLPVLSPLWLSSLKDYARIRLESDILALATGSEGVKATSAGGIDSMYSAATKEITLPVRIATLLIAVVTIDTESCAFHYLVLSQVMVKDHGSRCNADGKSRPIHDECSS